jgi:hypothetical protein
MSRRVLAVASAVLLSFGTSACTAEAPVIDVQAGAANAAVERADTGNDRPVVTFDGPLVRRLVVLEVAGAAADAPAIRAVLEPVAARLGMDLVDLPGTVLDARELEDPFPALTLALPEGRTIADGRALIDASFRTTALPETTIHVVTVLVHDLAFRVATADPVAVAASIEAEGILSDVLLSYEVTPGESELSVGYTGPLLSDRSIRAVRVGIARAANTEAAAVEVFPRTPTGDGVRLSDTATAPDAPTTASHSSAAGGGHGEGAAVTASAGTSPNAATAGGAASGAATTAGAAAPGSSVLLIAGGVALAWVALLVVVGRRRARGSTGVRHRRE